MVQHRQPARANVEPEAGRRLVRVWKLNPTTQSYVNWPTPTYNGVHELTKMGFATHLLYDPKGNMTNNGAGQVYAWDFNNRMETATVSGGPQARMPTMRWGGGCRRASAARRRRSTCRRRPGDCRVPVERRGRFAADEVRLRPVHRRAGDDGQLRGTYYYHQNNLYSVAALTAASDGPLKECYAYTPYAHLTVLSYSGGTLTDITATPSSWLGNPFLFTGRRYDTETGLQYSRARHYSNALGRFLGRDPIGYDGGVNLYEYVLGTTPSCWRRWRSSSQSRV